MEYYNHSYYPSKTCTRYQSQPEETNPGYQANTSYPWYNQMTSLPAVNHGIQQLSCYQDPNVYNQVANYNTRGMSSQQIHCNGNQETRGNQASETANPYCYMIEPQCGNLTGITHQVTTQNQTSKTAEQYCYTTQSQCGHHTVTTESTQNPCMMKDTQKAVRSNPLSMNFTNLRQAMEDDHGPVKADRKKYGDRKPPYSYVAMIHMAMASNPSKKCTLKEILDYIQDRFPYYTQHSRKLHGAIRHNLTLNDCFIKAGRRLGDKGCLWTLDKAYEGMFEHGGSLLRRKCRLLEGRVDKYKRNKNSKKSSKSAAIRSDMDGDGQQETDCLKNEQSPRSASTSPSSVSTYSVSPNERSSYESTPATTASSSPQDSSMSLFDLEQFADICTFPEFNHINKENEVNNICRRLSNELSEESSSPEKCSLNDAADRMRESDYSSCVHSDKTGRLSEDLPVKSSLQNDFNKTEITGQEVQFDVEFPAFLEIPDIMNEVDIGEVQSGFNTDSLSWN